MGKKLSVVKRECNLVLIGKTGSGKSSLGNSLLCPTGHEKPFESKTSGRSITKECQRERALLNDGTMLTIVDTPGLFDSETPQEDTTFIKEIVKCIALCAPGPDVILFVLSLKRISQEEIEVVHILRKLFGEEAMKYFIVVFTGKDELDGEDEIKTVEDFVSSCTEYIQKFVTECSKRYVGIANKLSSSTHTSDVKDVMKVINKTMEQNNGQCYSQEAFLKAEEMMLKEIKRRKQTSQKESDNDIRENIKKDILLNDSHILKRFGTTLKNHIIRAFGIQ